MFTWLCDIDVSIPTALEGLPLINRDEQVDEGGARAAHGERG